MINNSPDAPQYVYIGVNVSNPDNPTLTYDPPTFEGKVLASRNGVPLQFFGSHPFALIVLGKLKGPVNDVKSPFGKMDVLKSVKDPDATSYPWYIDPKDTIVRIPAGKWDNYEFCYIVIMATGLQKVPLVVSIDPKIIIGRENSVSGGTDTPPPTPEEVLQLLFPGSSPN